MRPCWSADAQTGKVQPAELGYLDSIPTSEISQSPETIHNITSIGQLPEKYAKSKHSPSDRSRSKSNRKHRTDIRDIERNRFEQSSSQTNSHKVPQYLPSHGKRERKFKDKLLDATYFICPDCSCIQCSAIIAGLIAAAILTTIFLYLGGYWDNNNDRNAVGPSI